MKIKKIPEITQEILHDLFDYKDGNLYWKEDRGIRIKAGDRAGTKTGRDGHNHVRICYSQYSVARLIFLYFNGYLPENRLTRTRKVKGTRIENLEEASFSCVQSKQEMRKDNKSGIKGINYSKKDKKWRVVIGFNYKAKTIGTVNDFLEACCLRYAAEQCLDRD